MNITKYLDQLLEDIAHQKERVPPAELYKMPATLEESMEQFENHVLEDFRMPVADFSCISQEALPEADLLSDRQLKTLHSALISMLEHFRFHLDYPKEVPVRHRYIVLRELWNEFKAPLARYDYYYEFCSYNAGECPFPSYCTFCDDYEDDDF